MRSYLIIAVVVLSSVLGAASQTQESTAPVKWERYRIGKLELSVLLPKLPIRIDSVEPCSERLITEYWAYAESAAYMVKVTSKWSSYNAYCEKVRKFNGDLFDEEMRAFATAKDVVTGTVKIGQYQGVRTFSSRFRRKYVFDEVSKGRWIELEIVSRIQDTHKEMHFVASLDGTGKEKGLKLDDGAVATIGDRIDPPATGNTSKPEELTKVPNGLGNWQGSGKADGSAASKESPAVSATPTIPLVIVAKPSARYTNLARQAKVQGTVILRTTFLPNGSIGAVGVVKSLPYGLSEEAVAAARKLVFLPAQINGANVAVTKQLEYTFSIY